MYFTIVYHERSGFSTQIDLLCNDAIFLAPELADVPSWSVLL